MTRPIAKGVNFARMAIALALADGRESQAARIAAQRWGEDTLVTKLLTAGVIGKTLMTKAEVPAGGTVGSNWAEDLASFEGAGTEFFALVRDKSLIGQIEGLRRIPLQTRLVSPASGFSAAWVGEGKAKPVSSATYDQNTLPPRKVVSLIVTTNELLESLEPAAELLIRNDMIAAMVATINASFIDPTNSGVAGVEPASISNGAPSTAASGDGASDIRELIASFPGDLSRAVLIGSPATFAVLSDPFLLPRLGVRGGEALGIPAIPATAAGDTLVLVDPAAIAVGEAETSLSTSREASIEMLDANLTGDSVGVVPGAAASTVTLFQTNSTAIKAEKVINWEVARPGVSIVTGVATS